MDLIKKLGGYEKAKQKYSERPFDLAWSDIGQALLDYRHQNNIFEVGDKVVMRGMSHCDICEFVEASTVLPMYMLKDENGCKFRINKKCVDHATDEEIKAGHRL